MLIEQHRRAFQLTLMFLLVFGDGVQADESVDLLVDEDFRKLSPAEQLAKVNDLQNAGQAIRDQNVVTGLAMVAYCVEKGGGDLGKELQALEELVQKERTGDGMPMMDSKRGHWSTDLFELPIATYLNEETHYQNADGPGKIRILTDLARRGILKGWRARDFFEPVGLDAQFEAVKDVPITRRGMARLEIIKKLRQYNHVRWALNEHLAHDETWANANPKEKVSLLVGWRDAGLFGPSGIQNSLSVYNLSVRPWVIAELESNAAFMAADSQGKQDWLKKLAAQKVIIGVPNLDEHFQTDESERKLDIEARLSRDKRFQSMTPLQQFEKVADMREQTGRAFGSQYALYYDGLMRRALIAHMQADDEGEPATLETEIRRFRKVMEAQGEKRRKNLRSVCIALNLTHAIDYQVNAAVIADPKNIRDVYARAQATFQWYEQAYGHFNYGNRHVAAWLWLSALVDRTKGARAPDRGRARIEAIHELNKELPYSSPIVGLDQFPTYEFAHENDLFRSKTMREAAETLGKVCSGVQNMHSLQYLETICWIRAFERDDTFPKSDAAARKAIYEGLKKKKLMSYAAAFRVERHFAGT